MCPGVISPSKKWVPGIPLGVKAAGAWGWRPTTLVVSNVKKSRALTYPDPLGPSRRPLGGETFTFTFTFYWTIDKCDWTQQCCLRVTVCRVQLKCDGTRWRKEGKWRGNWRMDWVASTLHTTSDHGVSSITTADANTSAASSRLKWRPRRFKWTRPFRRKTKSVFFCACGITFQTQSSSGREYSGNVKCLSTRTKASCTGKSECDATAPLFVATIQCHYCIMTDFIVYVLSLVKCYIWSIALYGAVTWTLRAIDQQHL